MGASLSPLQVELLLTAQTHLQHESWFRGVCLDNFPTQTEIAVDFNGSIHQVITATALRDDPRFNRHSSSALCP